MKSPDQFDSIVVGGGPAGSTAAALLAEKGRKVLVLEKETFPRYHVGESLMPFCYHTLDRLGVVDQMDTHAFTKKYSVLFVTQDGQKSRPFYFFQHYDHPSSTTWQVNRDEFDQLLLNKAEDNGATVRTGIRVKQLLEEENNRVVGVVAEDEEGKEWRYEAPITIDATGRDALVLSKRQWRVRDQKLNKIALWTYYKGGVRDPGLDAGSTTVAYLPEKGWFWFIPMKNDIISLGVVGERDYLYRNSRDPAEIMNGEVLNNVWIQEHLKGAEQFGRYWVTGEYSYRGQYCAGDGVVMVGDAFAFLDPVFSSGVFLALKSG
ncbi:MAG: NAD(P)/FAD-dependent oxidoreductase, partial [Verrucomicrobiota bacterium]